MGPYYSVLNFFQRVSELERIVNIDNLQMSNTKTTSPSKVKGTYQYAPGRNCGCQLYGDNILQS